MKKDRNCMGPMPYPIYPAYPNYQGMMPTVEPNNSIEGQLSNLTSQLRSLERRVSNLESLIGNNSSTGYNTSNYQMM